MNKYELLNELSEKVSTGEISREEAARAIGSPGQSLDGQGTAARPPEPAAGQAGSHTLNFSLTKALYSLGAAIVVIGIIFFVAQVWNDIGAAGRIAVTLVLGLIFAGLGSFYLNKESETHLGQVFHIIGGVLVPGGALVTLGELSGNIHSVWPVAITIGVIFLFYLLLTLYHRSSVLTFFAIANGTAFIYLLLASILEGGARYDYRDLYAYLTIAVGAAYVALAQSFRNTWNKYLVGLLHFFGPIFFFGGAVSQVYDSPPWQLLFFLLVIGGMALSVFIKSRAALVISTIFLVVHLIYITYEYFADSIGWPISLVILGLIIVGLAYGSVRIGKRYISR